MPVHRGNTHIDVFAQIDDPHDRCVLHIIHVYLIPDCAHIEPVPGGPHLQFHQFINHVQYFLIPTLQERFPESNTAVPTSGH